MCKNTIFDVDPFCISLTRGMMGPGILAITVFKESQTLLFE